MAVLVARKSPTICLASPSNSIPLKFVAWIGRSEEGRFQLAIGWMEGAMMFRLSNAARTMAASLSNGRCQVVEVVDCAIALRTKGQVIIAMHRLTKLRDMLRRFVEF